MTANGQDPMAAVKVRLIQTVAPPLYDPTDINPDISDSWTPQS